MKNRELIFKSIDLIEENIKNNISVYELSERFGFSFFYFSRLFKTVTGFSPKSYMLNRKVTESVNDILNSDNKIIEIAFDYGFASPESYSRAFQKVIGMNPSNLRKQNIIDEIMLFHPISKEKVTKSHIIPEHEPELIELGPLFLIGTSVYSEKWKIKDLTGPWQYLLTNISGIPDRKKPEKYYQLQTWSLNEDKETISFFIAVEVESIKEIPILFSAKKIPKQKYIMFLHRGLANKVGLTYQYIYEEWLPETEYRLPYFYNFEYYGDLHKGPCDEDSISEIYIPVE